MAEIKLNKTEQKVLDTQARKILAGAAKVQALLNEAAEAIAARFDLTKNDNVKAVRKAFSETLKAQAEEMELKGSSYSVYASQVVRVARLLADNKKPTVEAYAETLHCKPSVASICKELGGEKSTTKRSSGGTDSQRTLKVAASATPEQLAMKFIDQLIADKDVKALKALAEYCEGGVLAISITQAEEAANAKPRVTRTKKAA